MINFLFTSILLALTPGPDNLYLLNLSVKYGKKAALLFVTGLCTGLLVHTTVAVLGISALVISSQKLFFIVKVLGAIYLIYLALMLVLHTKIPKQKDPLAYSYKKLYFRGVFMNISNPKVLIFFVAFLPQFIDMNQNFYSQILLFSLAFIVVTFIVFSLLSLLSIKLAPFLQKNASVKAINYLTAFVLVFVALKLFAGLF